jgi:hypothetical protein
VLVVLALALATGLAARILDEAGVSLLPHLRGIALWLVPLVALFELRRVLRTLALVARRRQLRTEYRMPLDASATIVLAGAGDTPAIGRAHDISPHGLGLVVPRPLAAGAHATLTVALPTIAGGEDAVALDVEVLSWRPQGDRWAVGTRIARADERAQRRIVEYCYVVCQRERLRDQRVTHAPVPAREAPAAAVA